MPSISIQAGTAAVTSASALGVVTVSTTDIVNIYPGAWAWLYKTNGSNQVRVKIISIISAAAGTFQVRVFNNQADEYGNGQQAGAFYTFKDVSTFATASAISWNTQSVPVDPAFSKRNES
jgi:type IV secretory pathway TrbF-like protein